MTLLMLFTGIKWGLLVLDSSVLDLKSLGSTARWDIMLIGFIQPLFILTQIFRACFCLMLQIHVFFSLFHSFHSEQYNTYNV